MQERSKSMAHFKAITFPVKRFKLAWWLDTDQVIAWTNDGSVRWHTYASVRLSELTFACGKVDRQLQLIMCPNMQTVTASKNHFFSLQWRHNERDSVSNHQPHGCLLKLYSGTDERKHQSCASLASVRGIHRWPVNSPHKGPVTRKMFPFDDVIMLEGECAAHHK